MIIKIITGPMNYQLDKLYQKHDNEYIIGVDQGAYHAIKSGLTLDLALGDFDSIEPEQLKTVQTQVKKVVSFKADKDETDTYLAVKEALKLSPEAIIVYGGIGQRLDHTIANISLLKQGEITFQNETTIMFALNPGTHDIENPHHHISFFALEDVKNLSLKGFTYTMENYNLDIDDPLCVSNEGSGTVSFSEGVLLIIMTDEK